MVRNYNNQELREFGELLDRNFNGVKTVKDVDDYLISVGAFSKSKAVVPSLYVEHTHKLRELYKYESRVKYAKEKELEYLDKNK